jgi:DNA-binding phage protein
MDEVDENRVTRMVYYCILFEIVMEKLSSDIHIGHLIQEQLKVDQRSVGWLAREIGCTRNHVYKIFSKSTLDSDLIFRISKAMNFNFFQYYTAAFLESLKSRIGEE